jgi:lipopolysaccharide transport system ATP-binding protein
MSEVAIRVQNLGKKYQLGSNKAADLRNAFGEFISKFKPSDNNFTKLNRLPGKSDFWALKDISFEVKQGEAIGIIGRNGAGKSTLLKILSRITEPTKGHFTLNGRVSSLLEVGTGFHMELTGRENIYLNGTILGMKRREIREKFDEIVDFSGVEQFIDTPVKHYSSGMKVRLAFSVAAHLEPEILVIDEVLAVGDSEFQKKCMGKMEDVTGQGRTVLFVSHNLAAVNQLCEIGLLLKNGILINNDKVEKVIKSYISSNQNKLTSEDLVNLEIRKGDGKFRVHKIRMLNEDLNHINVAITGSDLIFEIQFNRSISRTEGHFRIDFAIDNDQDLRIGWYSTDAVRTKLTKTFSTIYLKIPKLPFGKGIYSFTFYSTLDGEVADYIHQGFIFEVEEGDFFGTGKVIPKSQTFLYSDHQIHSGI